MITLESLDQNGLVLNKRLLIDVVVFLKTHTTILYNTPNS